MGAEQSGSSLVVRSRVVQISVLSASVRASATSTPRYRTVFSNGRDGQRKNGSARTSVTVAWRLSTPHQAIQDYGR
jgi:hypothetical protein